MIGEHRPAAETGSPGLNEVIRHYWHPAAPAKEVGEQPLATRLLGESLVLWRSNGQVAAFYDLCIHRGTPLSLGWISDGQLVCAYHGWCYSAEGACTRIPSLPPERAIPAKARARSYHVQERHGFVWVCLDEPWAEIPEFPEEFADPTWGWDVYSSQGVWRANVARMVENLADFSHFAWVHPGILGDRERPECQQVEVQSMPGGFQYEIETPVNKFKPDLVARQIYRVILPFMLTIQRYQPGGEERQTNIYVFTPMSANETRYYRLAGRNYRDAQPDEELNRRHQVVFEQDRVIVEAQRPEELPVDLSEELHLRGPDTPTVEYRRRLAQLGAARS